MILTLITQSEAGPVETEIGCPTREQRKLDGSGKRLDEMDFICKDEAQAEIWRRVFGKDAATYQWQNLNGWAQIMLVIRGGGVEIRCKAQSPTERDFWMRVFPGEVERFNLKHRWEELTLTVTPTLKAEFAPVPTAPPKPLVTITPLPDLPPRRSAKEWTAILEKLSDGELIAKARNEHKLGVRSLPTDKARKDLIDNVAQLEAVNELDRYSIAQKEQARLKTQAPEQVAYEKRVRRKNEIWQNLNRRRAANQQPGVVTQMEEHEKRELEEIDRLNEQYMQALDAANKAKEQKTQASVA